MRPIDAAEDVSGQALSKGDTVVTVSGDLTGRIYDLAAEDETRFVRIRPLHMPYGKGVWYAADRLVRVASARRQGGNGGPQPQTRPVRKK
jgi:hypothetical protein